MLKSLYVCAAVAILTLPPIACAAAEVQLLGSRWTTSGGHGQPSGAVGQLEALNAGPTTAKADRYGAVLGRLERDRSPATRGANEERVYRLASPAVVLIVTDTALGSGAVIRGDGLIVTNLHVVGSATSVGVVFKPKVEGAKPTKADVRLGTVVKRDQVADLALVQVTDPPADVAVLQVGSSSDVEVGSDVHAIGHPTGEAWSYTRGIVSQIRRDFTWTAENDSHEADVIQTQTPINPGNSGGPLLNDDLKIVGINAFKSAGEGLNFAVSGEDIEAMLARSGDRMRQPVTTPAAVADGACKPTVIREEHRTTDPAGDAKYVDLQCDGRWDVIILNPDDPSKPRLIMASSKRNGVVDAIYVDEHRDGNIEYGMIDTVGDGKPHVKAYFKPGQSEPYRYERVDG